ncbi:MAG: class I SAM-dependent methyltransferase [Burkholderiales bacterium]
MAAAVPPYFDRLIEGVRRGEASRWAHLGHWDEPPAAAGRAEFHRAQERLDAVLLGMASLGDGLRVLDVGCGFGASLEAINRAFADMQMCGVNVDPRQLEFCRALEARGSNRFDWRVADACALPFADASFDRVLCIEAMFHFSSRGAFFAEAARVLAPGGLLVGSDILLQQPDPEALAAIRDGFGPWPESDAEHRALAAAAGLRCESIVDATQATLPSHRYTTPSAPAAHPDAMVRAALALRALHERGNLRYLYLRCAKPA